MRIRTLAASAIAAASLGMMAAPASADPYVLAFTGTANTSGTWAPASPNCGSVPCPANNSWNFGGTGSGVHGATAGSVTISGSGTFNGWCGSSQGQGSVTVSGIGSGSVTWNSAGGTIVLQGTVGGHSVTATVQARPIVGDCVTSAATQFLVAGVATGL